jgi:AAA+ superfamily predicted ATPase
LFNIAAPSPSRPARLEQLGTALDLDSFDCDVVVLALAPEIDLRYERIYAYLQDDVNRRRPSVDLALHLYCEDAAARLRAYARFLPDAPLPVTGVLALEGADVPLLARSLHLADDVVAYLIGGAHVVPHTLSGVAQVWKPSSSLNDTLIPDNAADLLRRAVRTAHSDPRLRLLLRGTAGHGKRAVAAALAHELERVLLAVDLTALPVAHSLGRDLYRTAMLNNAVVYMRGIDRLDERTVGELLWRFASYPGPLILGGGADFVPPVSMPPIGLLQVDLDTAATTNIRRRWLAAGAGTSATELAERFCLPARSVVAAVASARAHASLRGLGADPTRDELFQAARLQSARDLSRVAARVEARADWDDLVLPTSTLALLDQLCARAERRSMVLDDWGFGSKSSRGRGLTALFIGPSGCGKTLAAEVVAKTLGLDLYQIDLARTVSKYIGETEQNLERIFTAAENTSAMLFFDEADALFGKRSEVRDSHDRYANLEISYLLQRMERYDGIAILASNLRDNLDEAFTRRVALTVHFPFPDEPARGRLWEQVWPSPQLKPKDIDWNALATRYPLSGGQIQNAAVSAAYRAAADSRAISRADVLESIRAEFLKLGHQIDADDAQTPSP